MNESFHKLNEPEAIKLLATELKAANEQLDTAMNQIHLKNMQIQELNKAYDKLLRMILDRVNNNCE